jgi:ATP-binding cassette subfamily B protein
MSSTKSAVPVPRVLGFLFHHWGRQPVTAAFTGGCMAAATLADIATPIFAGRLVDAVGDAGHAGARPDAIAAVLWLVGLGAFMVGVRQLGLLGIVRFTLRMMTEVKAEAFARVQGFSASWHAESFAGSIVRQVLRGAGALDAVNDVFMFGLLPTAVVLAGATAVLGWRWPAMGAAVGAGSAIYLVLTIWLSLSYVAPAAELSNAWDTRVSGALADAITSNAAVRAFGAEQREEQRLGRVLGKWRRRTRRTWMRGIGAYSLQSLALVFLQGLITGTITWLWWQGRANAGDVAVVLTSYFVLHGYLRNMSQNVRELQRGLADMQELVGLWAQPVTVRDRPGAPALQVGTGRIDVRNVVFRYGTHGTPLFDNLSLSIAAGERVGLVGPSGSGKSTFVKLIQRLHDIDGGQILIDGQDIASVTQNSLRSQIAIVPQEPSLFHRSLAENIAYGRPGARQDDIERAAKLARAHEFIVRQPKGYATLVGERGVKLSGGERQRVAIARAFLADRPILILDEATSSLDSDSEAAIADAAERLMAGRTCIVIAHRLSTVRAMDRILVFRDGAIVEEGSHAALIARPGGLYRGLFERQALGLADAV